MINSPSRPIETPETDYSETIATTKQPSSMAMALGGLVLLVLGGLGGYIVGINKPTMTDESGLVVTPPPESEMVGCTMEARLCPDGSSVGRSGPNCEFAECPAEAVEKTSGIQTYDDSEMSFSYPEGWTIIKSIPTKYQYTFVTAEMTPQEQKAINTKMFDESCDGPVLLNESLGSIIAIDISRGGEDGAYCWSYGATAGEIPEKTVPGTTIKYVGYKWINNEYRDEDGSLKTREWTGDYFYTTFGSEISKPGTEILASLYTPESSRSKTIKVYEDLLTSIKIK